jgi:CubicO group peptidase (beta-lactamase class C family)
MMISYFKHLICNLSILVALTSNVRAQSYFPPLGTSTTWDTISPSNLGWCPNRLDTLHNFLDTTNTKGFIVLKNGKIVVEWYFDTFTKDSTWYWASAGKSMVGFLCGVAQQDGLLSLNDKTSTYLGTGWTTESAAQEDSIKIVHQLSMSTGLNDQVPDQDCTIDTCLRYKAAAGNRWAYHNAPYHLLQDAIAMAANAPSFQNYMNTTLSTRTGIQGLNANYVMYSKPRVMARFGLLMLNNGVWNGDSVLKDQSYFNAMISTSQIYNLSYGYLWWLNGKGGYMVPSSQFQFTGALVPSAPADMYCAMGKNDQRIYVIPSDSMVVVRVGASAYGVNALSVFDNALWQIMRDLECPTSVKSTASLPAEFVVCYPMPFSQFLRITSQSELAHVEIYDLRGQLVYSTSPHSRLIELSTSTLSVEQYVLQVTDINGVKSRKMISKVAQ